MTYPSSAMVAQSIGFVVLVALVLFGAAGRIDIPIFWFYVGVVASASAAGLFLIDKDLAQERMRPGGQLPSFRLILVILLCLIHWAIAGLDRFDGFFDFGKEAFVIHNGLLAVGS